MKLMHSSGLTKEEAELMHTRLEAEAHLETAKTRSVHTRSNSTSTPIIIAQTTPTPLGLILKLEDNPESSLQAGLAPVTTAAAVKKEIECISLSSSSREHDQVLGTQFEATFAGLDN